MSDYERGYRAGIEAAATVAEGRHEEWHELGPGCLIDDDISACTDIAAAIRALPVAEAADDEALAWHPGSEAPAIPSGTYAYFLVVVRRAQARADRQVFTFPACYLNAYPLEWNDGEGCGECPEDGSHDDGCPMTGWFDCRFSSDYDYYYEQLLSVGDEVLEWAAIPDRGAALREAGALR